MSHAKLSRTVGILLVVQLLGLITPFVLLLPMTGADYDATAASISNRIKFAVIWLCLNCVLTIGISILTFPIIQRHSVRLAIVLVAASSVMFALQAADAVLLMSMLSLSQQQVLGVPSEAFQMLRDLLGSARRWAHYPWLVAIDVWLGTLYFTFFRYSLVPRKLAVFGLFTVLLHFVAIPMPLILGYRGFGQLGSLMGLSHLLLAGRLIFKGFEAHAGSEILTHTDRPAAV